MKEKRIAQILSRNAWSSEESVFLRVCHHIIQQVIGVHILLHGKMLRILRSIGKQERVNLFLEKLICN